MNCRHARIEWFYQQHRGWRRGFIFDNVLKGRYRSRRFLHGEDAASHSQFEGTSKILNLDENRLFPDFKAFYGHDFARNLKIIRFTLGKSFVIDDRQPVVGGTAEAG